MTAARTNRLFFRLGLMLAILVIPCAAPAADVKAATCPSTYIVTSTADSGPGSLREAITDLCAGGTITFDRSLSGGTITLLSQLIIPRNMTIDGSTLTRQMTLSVVGGRIMTNNFDLTLRSLKFVNGAYVPGGAIGNSGTLQIGNSTFSGNVGGAIHNEGTVSINRSTFSGNSSTVSGSAIATTIGSTTTIHNSTFEGNTSGISTISNQGTMTLSASTANGIDSFNTVYNTGNLTLENTILSGADGSGFDCINYGGTVSGNGHNLIQRDFDCARPGDITGSSPLLGALADNGGPTRTLALQAGSPAIGAGDYALCSSAAYKKDQRGLTREDSLNVCDIGAVEYQTYYLPVVTDIVPTDGDVLQTSPATLRVIFNRDVDDATATNTANYLLVGDGLNDTFQTQDCLGGRDGDDIQITVNTAAYDSDTFESTLTVNGGAPLPDDRYRLHVCGTTSIADIAGTKLNDGANDTTSIFTMAGGAVPPVGGGGRGSSAVASLPATGFAPGRVTQRPERAVDYAGLDIRLVIPAMGVDTLVVGVPQNWDVSWLERDAGWLNGSAFPTWAGNSVITGHVWDADNLPGLFAGLKTLAYGDAVIIRAFGEVYTYEVRESRLVKPSDVKAVFRHEDLPWITLLTCADFNYVSDYYTARRIVRAVLIRVEPE